MLCSKAMASPQWAAYRSEALCDQDNFYINNPLKQHLENSVMLLGKKEHEKVYT